MRISALLVMFTALGAVTAEAQTVRTLCASGCTSTLTEANLQSAINASVGGDSILLQQGTTTDVALTLPSHTGASMVTIRTGVTSTGSLLSAGQFPAVNIRMTPALAASGNLAVLRAKTNNIPVIRTTDNIGAGGYWTLKHLGLTSNTYGGEALIQLGSDSNIAGEQDSIARIPANFTLEQLHIYGNPTSGQFRGLRIHVNNWTLKDSYIANIKANAEGQAIYLNSFSSGGTLTNNYIEGGAEGLLSGGAGGCCHPNITVSSASSSSAFVLSGRTDLFVGLGISVANAGGLEEWTSVLSCGTSTLGAACTSNTITVTPALSTTPSVGADVDWGIIPSDVTVSKNVFYKPATWRDPIVGTPQSVAASTSTSGGTLAAGTYSYRVVARHPMAVGNTARSTASAEVSRATSGSTSTVTITWSAVANATVYRVYGRNSGGQNIYWDVSAPTTTFTDTGSSGSSETVPTSSGTTWYIKNIFELKNARRFTIEGNVFDGIWTAAQTGYAIVITPSNNGNSNDSTTVEDITFRNNIIRNAAGVFQLTGRDVTTGSGQVSGRLKRVELSNNLAYGIGSQWGTSLRTMLISTIGPQAYFPNNSASNGPLDLSLRHNSLIHTTGNAAINFDLYKGSSEQPAENFIARDNIWYRLNYGMTGGNNCEQGEDCFNDHTSGASAWGTSVVADATCGDYPSGTFCPSSSQLSAEFENFAAGNYALKTTSAYHNAASDGSDIGANITTINALTTIALSGDNTGGPPPIAPPSISTGSLNGAVRGSTYAATLSGTCPAGTCTWGVLGGTTLPTGVSLTQVSSTSATLGGVLSAAGTFNPTITLTDSGSQMGSHPYTITITEIVEPEPGPEDPPVGPAGRPDRFNMDDRVLFGRSVDPSTGDALTPAEQVRTGDLWGDLSCASPVMKFLTGTSPAVTWRSMAFRPQLTVASLSTASAVTYTAAEVLGGLILRDPNGGNRSDVTPTAALLVAAIPCAAVGDVFDFDVRNAADAAETITITAGAGVTLSGTMTIAQSNTRRFKGIVTNVETPAVTIYSISVGVH